MTRHERPTAAPMQDESAERAVVGACLTNPPLFWDLHGKVEARHFSVPRLACVWQAMRSLGEDGKAIGREMIPLAIKGEERASIPLATFLAMLIQEAPDGSTARDLADVVVFLAGKRAVLAAIDRARAEVIGADIGQSIESVQEAAMGAIGAATGDGFDRHMRSIGDWGQAAADQIAATFAQGEDGAIGFTSGLRAIDEVWGRLMPKRLYVLAGMSGGGKSALARQLTESMGRQSAARGLGFGYVASLEMGGEEHAIRSLAEMLQIPFSRIDEGGLDLGEVERMQDMVKDLRHLPIMIDTKPRMKVSDMRNRMLRLRHQRGLPFAVIDHLLLIRPDRDKDSLSDRVAFAVMEAKEMAKEFEIPVILLSQIDEKKVNERASGRPIAADLFGGQTIKQNADAVGFVHRMEIVEKSREPPRDQAEKHAAWATRMERLKGKAQFFNDKRRGGQGQVSRNLEFDGPTMTFRDP